MSNRAIFSLSASEGPCPTCSPLLRGGVGGVGDLLGGQVRGNSIIINLTERGEYVRALATR